MSTDRPDPVRLLGDDEDGWFIDNDSVDPLMRTWDTAKDAMEEIPGKWWHEEPGVWMCLVNDILAEKPACQLETP